VRLLERLGTIGIVLVLAAFAALLLYCWRVLRRERVHRRSLERQLAELDG
jgi:O-antigen ligase